MILAGDIGGTNTRLALFDEAGELKILAVEKYPSGKHAGLEEIISVFLAQHKSQVRAAAFGIAGPVREGRCKATNLPWEVDSAKIAKALNIPRVRLVNDLEANANGLKVLKPEELYCLQKGHVAKGNQALIAAGTGLGEACLYWDGKAHHPFACEGGHTDFSPRDELEIELLLFLKKKHRHVSWERVVSGPAIVSIYEFFTTGKGIGPKVWTSSPEICEEKDEASKKTVDLFLSLYGAEAGNVALKFLSLGGMYIGGGIAPKLVERMKISAFTASFSDKGRFQDILETIPIYVVMNDKAALLGAASFGRDLL
jgi:glucokinase